MTSDEVAVAVDYASFKRDKMLRTVCCISDNLRI